MLDFGWAELLIIVAVAVFVIGPKDIPNIMYSLGRGLRRIQYIKFAVSQQFDEIMNTGDIQELRDGVNFETKRAKDDDDSEVESEADEDLDFEEELEQHKKVQAKAEQYPDEVREGEHERPPE